LFVVELGSAVWTRGLQWRALVAAITASVLVSVFLSGITMGTWGHVTPSYLLNFGAFSGPMPYPIIQFPLFLALGIAGGILGAIFNTINFYVNRWRFRHLRTNLVKVLESVLIILVSSLVAFSLPYFLLNCRELAASDNAADFPLYYCPQGCACFAGNIQDSFHSCPQVVQ
jgi:chloride channel 7